MKRFFEGISRVEEEICAKLATPNSHFFKQLLNIQARYAPFALNGFYLEVSRPKFHVYF